MKKASVLFFVSLTMMINLIFADNYITRGPAIGEIYFIGPTHSGMGIYHSTNFGETAICMDSIIANEAISIVADKTPGVLYYVTSQEKLYISYNFGQQSSWQFINSDIYVDFMSGRNAGEIYNVIASHSIDYGLNFIPHTINGYFGSLKSSEIDNSDNIGYAIVTNYSYPDSLYLLFTNDNFENLAIRTVFNFANGETIFLRRGNLNGEMYLFNNYRNILSYSSNYANDWNLVEHFNFINYYSLSTAGGRQNGEIYFIYNYVNMAWQNAHTYILHSTDFGVTFEVFHPFSKGEEPLLANFSGIPDTSNSIEISRIQKAGEVPLDVQFYNYSIGNISKYEWDFDNDGLTDSFDENPLYTYTDTGLFSVRLTVYNDLDTNSFLKENYIYVDFTTNIQSFGCKQNPLVQIYPNPVSNQTAFEVLEKGNNNKNFYIEIFDMQGNPINKLPIKEKVVWDRKDFNQNFVKSGIYLYKLSVPGCDVNKMILK